VNKLVVATSTVADGSMYNRNDHFDPEVFQNREKFLSVHGITIMQTSRVRVNYDRTDFCEFIEVKEEDKGGGMSGDDIAIADALITKNAQHALLLPVADCVGAFLYDPLSHVLAVAHLGRHSLEQQGGFNLVTHLKRTYGSDPATLRVWLTPAPSKDNYKIWKLNNKGMKEATFEQLYAAGILQENITDNPAESDKDPNYFSYSAFLKGNRDIDGDYAIIAMMTE
jgi:copper oxidase (laccase) domain-containing protein